MDRCLHARALGSRLRRLDITHPALIDELEEIIANHQYELTLGDDSWRGVFAGTPHLARRTLTACGLQVLQQLQGIDPARISAAVERIVKTKKDREQRAIVLDLLAGIRGVRISELGKVGIGGNRDDAAKKASKGKWLGGGMDVESSGIVRGNTPPDGGLGELFGN